jgi:hypothetical protein
MKEMEASNLILTMKYEDEGRKKKGATCPPSLSCTVSRPTIFL